MAFLSDSELDALLEQLPAVAGQPRRLEELSGGLTNRNIKITTPTGSYVARCSVYLGEHGPVDQRGRLQTTQSLILGVHYEIPWPNRELTTARPFRRSPVHHVLAAAGANFGSRMGWERANFFAPPGAEPVIEYSWGKQNWLPWSAAEQVNTRTAVTVFDQTSFSKYVLAVYTDLPTGTATSAVHSHCRACSASGPQIPYPFEFQLLDE